MGWWFLAIAKPSLVALFPLRTVWVAPAIRTTSAGREGRYWRRFLPRLKPRSQLERWLRGKQKPSHRASVALALVQLRTVPGEATVIRTISDGRSEKLRI